MSADAAASDAATGNLWYADNIGINGVDLDGGLLLDSPITLPNEEKVTGLAADGERGLLWAVTRIGQLHNEYGGLIFSPQRQDFVKGGQRLFASKSPLLQWLS